MQQVYVRSTARVYEIYYTTGLQKSNEYLCTVRCGIATRDGEVLHTTGVQEAILAHQEPVKDLAMRSKNEGAVDANKDDWVEVEPPVLDLRSSPLPSSFDGDHPGGSIQVRSVFCRRFTQAHGVLSFLCIHPHCTLKLWKEKGTKSSFHAIFEESILATNLKRENKFDYGN